VAVSYKFGDPESARGWIDARPLRSNGTWAAPRISARGRTDDEVWIGTVPWAGSASSSLRGRLDEIAVYRTALSADANQSAHVGPSSRNPAVVKAPAITAE